MPEYFIAGNSNAAPFFSDSIKKYVEADTPEAALLAFVESKPHPCGVYGANAYSSADAMKKGEKPLAQWLCNFERVKRERTKHLGVYSFCRSADDVMEIDGETYKVKNPREGSLVAP